MLVPLSPPPPHLMARVHYYFTDLNLQQTQENPPSALKPETYDFLPFKCSHRHKALFDGPPLPSHLTRPHRPSFPSVSTSPIVTLTDGTANYLVRDQASPLDLVWANVFMGGFCDTFPRGHVPRTLQDKYYNETHNSHDKNCKHSSPVFQGRLGLTSSLTSRPIAIQLQLLWDDFHPRNEKNKPQ